MQISTANRTEAYVTKDGSTIRELHGTALQ